MADERAKKGFFARINEALYETVETSETGEQGEASGAQATAGRGPAGVADPAAPQSLENPPELAARVRADIEGRGQALTQFLSLAASFAEIIPDESGRFRAALKAMEKTGNISRKEVIRAANDQLRALGSQREVFAGAVDRKREDLKAQGGGVEALRAQIAELQQTIGQLQAEEQQKLRAVAVEEAKIKSAEEKFSSLLSTMEAEIKASLEKIEKYIPG
jgi:hypothetical protein